MRKNEALVLEWGRCEAGGDGWGWVGARLSLGETQLLIWLGGHRDA